MVMVVFKKNKTKKPVISWGAHRPVNCKLSISPSLSITLIDSLYIILLLFFLYGEGWHQCTFVRQIFVILLYDSWSAGIFGGLIKPKAIETYVWHPPWSINCINEPKICPAWVQLDHSSSVLYWEIVPMLKIICHTVTHMVFLYTMSCIPCLGIGLLPTIWPWINIDWLIDWLIDW